MKQERKVPLTIVELMKKKVKEKHMVNEYLEGKITLKEAGIKLVTPI